MLKVAVLCSWNENGDILHKAVLDEKYVYYREPCNNSKMAISCNSDEVIQLSVEMVSKAEWDNESYLVDEAIEELQITEEDLFSNYELYYLNSWNGAKIIKVSQIDEMVKLLTSKPIMWNDEFHL